MLGLVEEILLLTLDDASGAFRKTPEYSLELAISGAILMDLALRDRVDADPERLMVVDGTPTGDGVLDPVLRELERSEEQRTLREWILVLGRVPFLRERALQELVDKGILRREEKKFLWVFGSRRYPMVDGRERTEAKTRILSILSSGEVPEPRDVALICLTHACKLFPSIMGKKETRKVEHRIEEISQMDLIGQRMQVELGELFKFVQVCGWWQVSPAYDLEARIRAEEGTPERLAEPRD
jgi:Golgi phosphoprotein 3